MHIKTGGQDIISFLQTLIAKIKQNEENVV